MPDDFYEPGPYAPMALGYDDDPKIAALAQYGDDAGLHRDLHLAMIRYASRARTDGIVRAIEVRRLAFPLSSDRAEQLALNLAERELLVPLDSQGVAQAIAPVIAHAIAPAMWRIVNYERWNRTRAWLDARHDRLAEQGRHGALSRWAGHSPGHSPGHSRRNGPGTSTSTYTETQPSPARAPAPAREGDANGQPEDDDELLNTIKALIFPIGAISHDQARAYRDRVLAGRTVDDPRSYVIAAIRRDTRAAYREATAAVPISARRQPPAAGRICHRCSKTGHAPDDCPTLTTAVAPADDRERVAAVGGPQLARELLKPAADAMRHVPDDGEPAAADDDRPNPADYPY